jgi:hypothetical protein
MANKARIKKADKGKYEGREYLDYDEACDYLGMKKATLYNYMGDQKIETYKFIRDRRHYLAMEDVKEIEMVATNPWLAGHGVTEQAKKRAMTASSSEDTAPKKKVS